MAIAKSNEFKGIGFNYDPAAQPFFKAMVKENLRKLEVLPTGKMLLKAIADAKPEFRSRNYPKGVNVVIQPPYEKTMLPPGAAMSQGKVVIRDDVAYQSWDNRKHGALVPGGLPSAGGGMTATLLAKTLGEPSDATKGALGHLQHDGKPSGGCTCTLKFSNIEIMSKTGQWLPDFITMGHELIHCWHMLNGSAKVDIKSEEWMTVGIKGFDGMPITENRLRSEAGLPARTKYFPDD